jgi:hypothetical protein
MSHRTIQRSTLKMSRQAMRMRYLTRDARGPKMRRLDLLVSQETFAKLEEIMVNTNLRRREALDLLIGEFHNRLKAEAKVRTLRALILG